MNYKAFSIAVLLVAFTTTGNSQSYYFRKYQVENGLSNNATICTIQDKKGFLWFGTKDGLNRFDGYSFKIFRTNPDDSLSIGSNFIHCLYEDKNEVLWVGTENGLYKYDAITERFKLFRSEIVSPIRDIKMDEKGTLWFIAGFTLYKYSQSKTIESYNVSTHFEVTSICTLPDGSLWVATPTGLLKKYNQSNNSFSSFDVFQHSNRSAVKWIEKIYATADGSILVGTSNQGAKIFDLKSYQFKDILTYNADKTEIFVRNFLQISQSEFWIGTESGIFIYNQKTRQITNLKKTYNDPFSISDNAVYSFCKDKEGGIWAGTYFGGVNYHHKQPTPFKKFFPKVGENSLSGNIVREIHNDLDGNLWIGTEDAGLNKYDTATKKFTAFVPTGSGKSISYTNIHGLLVDSNKLWIGTFEHGLDVMNIKTGEVMQHYAAGSGANDLKSNFIYCITKTNDGEIMLGTTRGAYTFNRQRNNFDPIPAIPLNTWYTSILKDNNGIIWAATFGYGVYFYNTKRKKSGNYNYDITNNASLSSNRVNNIFEDSDKNLWFATEGGLCKLNQERNGFTRYTTKNGFPSNFILSILEDAQKNLWISTSKGLVVFDKRTQKLKTFTTENGTLNDQFNFNSAYKDGNGKMYFGSVKGMIRFNPADFIKDEYIPPVYITGFQVFNTDLSIAQNGSPLKKSIINTEKITLKNSQSTISIDFAALSFTAPEMSEYAYKMEGIDNNWTSLKQNRKAYFTDLSPGTYVFKVKAANSSGIWNNKETQLVIEILPPWWASKVAYGFYILMGLLFIYLCIRYYHNLVNAKNRRKFELLEIAKEKEIYEAKINFFTNVAHEIRTPLTLIKAPLEKVIKKLDSSHEVNNYLKIMERNTERLIDLTTQLLDFRQTEIKGFSLSFIRANITELVEDAYSSFTPLAEQKNLLFDLNLPPAPVYAFIDPDAFNKILFNLLNNAVIYAKKKVSINLVDCSKPDNMFTIEVKNDGPIIPADMADKIFEPFVRLKQTEKQKGTGIGLALSLSLVQLHNGALVLKKPEHNMNIFSLTLPINQESKFTHKTKTDALTNELNNA